MKLNMKGGTTIAVNPIPVPTFADTTARVRRYMTAAELARICGVSERQVHYWTSGAYSPGPASRRRLLDLDAAIGVLEEIYTPEGVTYGLHARHRVLGQPIVDALMDGRADEVLAELEQAAAGAHT